MDDHAMPGRAHPKTLHHVFLATIERLLKVFKFSDKIDPQLMLNIT